MKTIYIINYGTNQYFEKNVGNKYYCKSLTSLKQTIKTLLFNDGYHEKPKEIKKAIKPLDDYIFNTKTCFNPGIIPNLELDNIYIGITTETLY